MGTGWRRAFCTATTPRRGGEIINTNTNTNTNNPSTPRRVQSNQILHCRTTGSTPDNTTNNSNPSSPRSPFSLFKSSLRLSFKNNCGICLQRVKTGQGTAIFTAECSHAFHFPCIAAHVKNPGGLVCPVCQSNWRQVPLLSTMAQSEQPPPPNKDSLPKLISVKKTFTADKDDDDEPLLSPRVAAQFNPIPEADNENQEEVEEFQGFFVDPKISSSSMIINKNVDVKLQTEAVSLISTGRSHQTYAVVLKIKAPAQSRTNSVRRAPIDLVTVLDVSGSMTGEKLQMLKRAMRLVISSLSSADRLSIVAFSAIPKKLLPLRKMSGNGQSVAQRIIDRLVCGQGTSVSDALKKATKVLEDRRERNPIASIMLLSGGQDDCVSSSNNRRGRKPSSSSSLSSSHHATSTRFAHLEIPVQEFGFGYSQENDTFEKSVGGLLSVVVQDLRLQLRISSSTAEISAVYSCNGRPTLLGSGSVSMGDLYAQEEKELLVELRVPTVSMSAQHVMTVGYCYTDPETQEVIYGKEQPLMMPDLQSVVQSSAPNIQRLRSLFVTTRAIAESGRLVELKDLSNAFYLLSSARTMLMQSSSDSADEYVQGLEGELAKLRLRRQQQQQHMEQQRRTNTNERETTASLVDEDGEPLTPTSAWRAAEKLAKVAIMRKSLNTVSDLHGFENARF